MTTITHEQLIVVGAFADDLRKNFPIPTNTDSLADELKTLIYRYAWDVIATIEKEYRIRWEMGVAEMEVALGKK